MLTGDQQVRLAALLAECSTPEAAESADGTNAAGESRDSAVDDDGVADEAPSTDTLTEGSGETDVERDICRIVVDAIEFDIPEIADNAAIVDALDAAIGGLRAASADAGVDQRQELENAAAIHEILLPTFAAIDAGFAEFGTVDAEAATALVVATPRFLRGHGLMVSAPNLVSDCDITTDIDAFIEYLATAQEFLLTEAGQGPAHDGLRDLVASMNEAEARNDDRPTAGLVDEYDQCAAAPAAKNPGDDSGCDEVYEACDVRNMLACNDLFWISAVGSEYERFAATCGDRTEFGREGYGGFCDQLDEP